MPDIINLINVVSHIVIIIAYMGLGIYVWPKFDAAGPGWGVQAARISGQIFFITCAYTHAHDVWHIYTQTPIADATDSWHYIGAHILQATSAPSALYFGWKYTALRFVSPDVSRMLDRMTKESKKRLAILKKQSGE